MHDTEDIPFTPEAVKRRLKRLDELYKRIDAIPEDNPGPGDLARKVTLYIEAQGVIGDLYSQAVYDYGIAYNARKEQQSTHEFMFLGTIKEKESYAEMKIADLRKTEARTEAAMKRWEKAYNNYEQMANAIKHELGVVFDDYKMGGRS